MSRPGQTVADVSFAASPMCAAGSMGNFRRAAPATGCCRTMNWLQCSGQACHCPTLTVPSSCTWLSPVNDGARWPRQSSCSTRNPALTRQWPRTSGTPAQRTRSVSTEGLTPLNATSTLTLPVEAQLLCPNELGHPRLEFQQPLSLLLCGP